MPLPSADLPAPDNTKTLNEVEAGRDFLIRELNGPSRERLRDLGFREASNVRKLSGGRNLICSISGTRLAISRELADQVLVSPLP